VGLAAQSTEAQLECPPQPLPPEVPAGLACEFPLGLDALGAPNRVCKEFTDGNGNVVRLLMAGKGDTLTFTNLSTHESLVQTTGGSVAHVKQNSDGTQTWTSTGHNVLILFPTDDPAGPSTTLYVGKLVFNVDPATGVFTLQSVAGTSTDICAALSD
jgi:hypothetical protein